MQTLFSQSVSRKGKYCPVKHHPLKLGDIVLIKEENTKINNYPMGRIKEVFLNDLGETTHNMVIKGRTKQISKLHVTQLIPYLSAAPDPITIPKQPSTDSQSTRPKSVRQAAQVSQKKIYEMLKL